MGRDKEELKILKENQYLFAGARIKKSPSARAIVTSSGKCSICKHCSIGASKPIKVQGCKKATGGIFGWSEGDIRIMFLLDTDCSKMLI